MIDVAFTRADLRAADVAVVVDVLRATSTATQALAAGYRGVLCVESVERALQLRAPGRVIAGERHCRVPPGFDLGNSPVQTTRTVGDELVLATTNGAPTIVAAARHASVVLLASLLNLEATLAVLGEEWTWAELQIVCSGTDGRPALEDTYVAGRICRRLRGPRTDAARIAEGVALTHARGLDALAASDDARVLCNTGQADDIEYCARESRLAVVGRVTRVVDGVAAVADVRPALAAGDSVTRMIERAA